MDSQKSTMRQIAWIALIPQFTFMGLLTLGFYFAGSKEPVLYGAITYLIFSFGLKKSFATSHQKGITFVKQQEYPDAITCFENSYNFFYKYPWMDKYRYLTLLDSSRISYREMALCNIAFCLYQINERMKAILYYKQALKEFPSSEMASVALQLMLPEDELKATKN